MGTILTAARDLSADHILSARDVGVVLGKALEDGRIHRGEQKDLEKIRDELNDKMTPDARMALRKFLAMGPVFDGNLAGHIFGLTNADADGLEMAGVRRVGDLLMATRTPSARTALSDTSKIDKLELTDFAERADLARVIGIGKRYAGVLDALKVNNVQSLAKQRTNSLYKKIKDFLKTDEGKAIARRAPGRGNVAKWIDNADLLPFVLRYAGDSGPRFTKTAFMALSEKERGRLILGMDIDMGGGSVFISGDLHMETPQRKPAAIKDFIDKVTSGERIDFPNGAGFIKFESGTLDDIKRVKVGDDTVGYKLEFEVTSENPDGYEYDGGYGYEYGPGPNLRGWFAVALDKDGTILDHDQDILDYDYEW